MSSEKKIPFKKFKNFNKANKERFQNLSISKMIPNIATVIALCTGLSSIRFALLERYEQALLAIIVAAFFDAMDGRLARLLGAASDFGAELDSLSDFVSFGIAPAIVLYIISLHHLGGVGWGVSLIFSVCIGLRLARFNTSLRSPDFNDQPDWTKEFFTGTPAPASAMIALLPLLLYAATGFKECVHPFVCSIFMIGSGLLAVSRLPTYSFKNIQIPRKRVLFCLILVGSTMAALLSEPWLTLSLLVITYLFTLPYSLKNYRTNILSIAPDSQKDLN